KKLLISAVFFALLQVNAGNSVTQSLIGRWQLNEGKGSIAQDSSGQGHNGKISGGNWLRAGENNFLLLNSKEHITIKKSSELNFQDEITFACWIYLTVDLKDAPIEWNPFFKHFSNAYFLAQRKSGIIHFRVDGEKTNVSIGSKTVFAKNTWYHLAGGFKKNGEIKLYVNGVLEAKRRFPVAGFKFLSATKIQSPVYNSGIVSDVCIYKRSLNESEIDEQYRTGLPEHSGKIAEKIQELQSDEVLEDFEKGVSKLWETAKPNNHINVTVSSSPEEVINGSHSIYIESKSPHSVKFLQSNNFLKKRYYTLKFKYKILEKKPSSKFYVAVFSTPPYKNMHEYYTKISPKAWRDIQWGRHYNPQMLYFNDKVGNTGEKKFEFLGCQGGNYKIAFGIKGGGRVSIDDISLKHMKLTGDDSVPVLTAPVNKSVVSDFAVSFFWKNLKNAVEYELQLSQNQLFTDQKSVILKDNGVDQGFWIPEEQMEKGKWFWRIRGLYDSGKKGAWSSIRSVNIKGTHTRKSPEKEISPVKPLILFMPLAKRFKNRKEFIRDHIRVWNKALPSKLKPYCGFRLFVFRKEIIEGDYGNLIKIAEKMEENKIPFFFEALVGFSPSQGPASEMLRALPLPIIEYIFQRFRYARGIVTGEQQIYDPLIVDYNRKLYRLVAKYGRYYIPMEFSPQFWFWYSKQLRQDASSYSRYIIPVMKNNFYNLIGHGGTLGWWLAHKNTNFGLAEEWWWWYEAGYSKLNIPSSRGKRSMKFCAPYYPATIWGIFTVLNMMTGGTAYIYELPTGGWSCKYKDSMTFWDTEGRLTFAGKNVMLPLLEDMIEHKLIPAKEAIIDKVKV
ncbi:MAG: LamG-like jellyroll fold domain-containing protein, partial [Victivallaceae bacterium]